MEGIYDSELSYEGPFLVDFYKLGPSGAKMRILELTKLKPES